MVIIETLNKIPLILAFILAIIGTIPFFMALKKPPQGAVKISLFSVVYIAGAAGMLSVISQMLLTGA